MRDWADVHNELVRLAGGGDPVCNYKGLCFHLSYMFDKFTKYVVIADAEGWEHFSGDEVYPVPSEDDEYTAEHAYDNAPNLWADDYYGRLRRDLCAYLAECIEEKYL